MATRPDALGLEIKITSIDDVDAILHELSWLEQEQAKLNALAKQKIDAVKLEFQNRSVVLISAEMDGDAAQTMTINERVSALKKPLEAWIVKHAEKHCKGKKRSFDLPHGTIGLRQQPLTIDVSKHSSVAKVLDAIDAESDSMITTIRSWVVKKLKSLSCLVGDLIKIETTLNLKGIKEAYDEKRLSREQIESLGLTIRDAYDDAVIKPAKTVVSAE
jgi:phage host-nuclease inhibitor protein Gam